MPRVSHRDRDLLRRQLTEWLAAKLPAGSNPDVGELSIPSGTGMSSDTLLFDARWSDGGGRFVARMEPASVDLPVFPTYDLDRQYRCMQVVAEHSDVPVPAIPWIELDPGPLGAPFFVMERIDGVVPSDDPPYVFGGWLMEASAEERAKVVRGVASVHARLHRIDPRHFAFLGELPIDGQAALDAQLAHQRGYYDWAREGVSYPILERAFAWLDTHRPMTVGPPVLNWGDARIGNVLWRDFEPVAVLDWEMATIGPAEVDVAWAVFMNRFFQDLAERYQMPGIPGFMERDDVVAAYGHAGGRELADLRWYELLAALRMGVISIRTSRRAVLNGDLAEPESPEGLIMHRPLLEEMLASSP